MSVNFKNIDLLLLDDLGNIGFDPGHQKGAEVAGQAGLTEKILCTYQFNKQLAGVVDP